MGFVRADGARRPGAEGWSAGPSMLPARPAAPTRALAPTTAPFSPEHANASLGDKENCDAACRDFVKTSRALLAELDPVKRTALTDHMVEVVANSWTVIPIIEGMGYYAINDQEGRPVRGDRRPARAGRRVRAHPAAGAGAVEEVSSRASCEALYRAPPDAGVRSCSAWWRRSSSSWARLTGNPVDLMLPEDATAEDRAALTRDARPRRFGRRPVRDLRREAIARRSRHLDPHEAAGGRGASSTACPTRWC